MTLDLKNDKRTNSYGYGLEPLYDSSIYVFDTCVLSIVNFCLVGENVVKLMMSECCFVSVYLCLSSLCVTGLM